MKTQFSFSRYKQFLAVQARQEGAVPRWWVPVIYVLSTLLVCFVLGAGGYECGDPFEAGKIMRPFLFIYVLTRLSKYFAKLHDKGTASQEAMLPVGRNEKFFAHLTLVLAWSIGLYLLLELTISVFFALVFGVSPFDVNVGMFNFKPCSGFLMSLINYITLVLFVIAGVLLQSGVLVNVLRSLLVIVLFTVGVLFQVKQYSGAMAVSVGVMLAVFMLSWHWFRVLQVKK